MSEYLSAQATGVFFIRKYSNKSFGGANILIYKNLFEIKAFICNKTIR